MPFQIEISPDAQEHLRALKKSEQRRVLDSIEAQLMHEPLVPTRNRKPLRSNLISTWELRIGEFRAYYDVDEPKRKVLIRAIGIKDHGRVHIGGVEVDLG